jgi:hypothetical protein
MPRSEPSHVEQLSANSKCTLFVLHIFRRLLRCLARYIIPRCTAQRLLLLSTTTTSLLSSLNALLISLDITRVRATHHATEATGSFPGTLELAHSRLAEEVDLDEVALERALEGDDRLDEERVGVVEVQVHNAHHADAHELRLEQAAQLLLVVGVHGCGDDFGLFGAAHGGGLDVFHHGHVCEGESVSYLA